MQSVHSFPINVMKIRDGLKLGKLIHTLVQAILVVQSPVCNPYFILDTLRNRVIISKTAIVQDPNCGPKGLLALIDNLAT